MTSDTSSGSICFLVSPIGDAGTPIREASNVVRDYLVRPALESLGLTVLRGEEIERPGYVTHHIIELLDSARLVVADLTGRNPNVYYELGLRHCFQKPALLIAAHGEELPADVVHQRVVFYDTTDPRVLSDAVAELRAMARAALDGDATGPVTVAAAVSALTTGSASGTVLAEVLGALSELRAELGTNEDRLDQRRNRLVRELGDAVRVGLSVLADRDVQPELRRSVGQLVDAARRIVDEFGTVEDRIRVSRAMRAARTRHGVS